MIEKSTEKVPTINKVILGGPHVTVPTEINHDGWYLLKRLTSERI